MKIPTPITALAVLAVALLLPGCTDEKADRATSASSTTSRVTSAPSTASTTAATPETSPTSTAAPTDTHPAIAAELAFWDRYIEVTGRTGPADLEGLRVELGEFTTGAETSKLFEFVQGNAVAGRSLKGTMDHSPRLASADDTTAEASVPHTNNGPPRRRWIVVEDLGDGDGAHRRSGTIDLSALRHRQEPLDDLHHVRLVVEVVVIQEVECLLTEQVGQPFTITLHAEGR